MMGRIFSLHKKSDSKAIESKKIEEKPAKEDGKVDRKLSVRHIAPLNNVNALITGLNTHLHFDVIKVIFLFIIG